jgi:predicted XRE-type DNA-binding protein
MERSSGNVFGDLGFGTQEADHRRIRSELMIHVRKVIERRRLTQAGAAKLFGVTPPTGSTPSGRRSTVRIETSSSWAIATSPKRR